MADEPAPFSYVSLDPGGEIVRLRLPPEHEEDRAELLQELAEEFSFEPRGPATERRMNEYVHAWLARRRSAGRDAGSEA